MTCYGWKGLASDGTRGIYVRLVPAAQVRFQGSQIVVAMGNSWTVVYGEVMAYGGGDVISFVENVEKNIVTEGEYRYRVYVGFDLQFGIWRFLVTFVNDSVQTENELSVGRCFDGGIFKVRYTVEYGCSVGYVNMLAEQRFNMNQFYWDDLTIYEGCRGSRALKQILFGGESLSQSDARLVRWAQDSNGDIYITGSDDGMPLEPVRFWLPMGSFFRYSTKWSVY